MRGDRTRETLSLPFDAARLDTLLEEAGLDVLLVTSRHNVQYLTGGCYRFFFFEHMEAIAQSRYLPILLYPKGRPEDAAYIGAALEAHEHQLGRFWAPHVVTSTWGSTEAMRLALEQLARIGGSGAIGVEASFLPFDAARMLEDAAGDRRILDATFALERLRLLKTPEELRLLRRAADLVVESMGAVFDAAAPGMTKHDLVRRLRREETERELSFEYCLITAGTSLNRAPSDQRLEAGDIFSLDSGGNHHGYIGDLCRMGILGEPDAELSDLLGLVDEIQTAARGPIRAGTRGGDIFAAAMPVVERSPFADRLEFVAHGMGLVSHEGPRLTSTGSVPYHGYDEDRPLEADMVLSIETTLKHPRRGFIKLEDAVAVTADGWDGLGDTRRGWNRAGG